MQLSDLCEYPQSRKQRINQIGLLVFLTAVFSLPFLDKAYHVDDFTVLEAGRWMLDFEHFFTKPFYSFGEKYASALDFYPSLVVPYVIHWIMRIDPSASETVFHAIFLVFTISAIVGTYLFCVRFSRYPFLITLSLLCSPVFYVQSQNIMSDVALYAFAIGAMVCFTHAVDNDKRGYLVGAVVLFALAVGTGWQSALLLFPAFFLYSHYRQPRKSNYRWYMWLSLLPMLIFYGGQLLQLGRFPNPLSWEFIKFDGKAGKYLYFMSNFSLAFISPIGLSLAVFGRKHWRTSGLAVLLAAIIFIGAQGKIPSTYSYVQTAAIFAGLFFTLLALGMICKHCFRDSDKSLDEKNDLLFLTLTLLIYFIGTLVFTGWGANRHMIPIMVFALVLLLRCSEAPRLRLVTATLAISMLISVGAAKADYELAGFYKKFAKSNIVPIKNTWFEGEWGMREYMQNAGYRYLSFDSHPNPGDLIVEPTSMLRLDISRFKQVMKLKEILKHDSKNLRVLSFWDHIDFWSQGWGFLPYWVSKKPLEEIKVYELMPEVIPFNLLTANDSFVLPAEFQLATRNLGGQARQVLLRDGKPGFAFMLQPKDSWVLQFGMGFTARDGTKAAQANFKITAVSGDERKVLFDGLLNAAEDSRATWIDREVDLTPYKGRLVKLLFQISELPSDAEAFWSSLNLVEVKDVAWD